MCSMPDRYLEKSVATLSEHGDNHFDAYICLSVAWLDIEV